MDVAVGIFAGIAVRDYTSAVEWYRRLLGAEPAFYPNDVEAVWQLAEDRYVYIIEAPERAGGAVSMIWVDDPVSEVAKISRAGLEAGGCREARRGVEVRLPRRRRQRDRYRWRGLDPLSAKIRLGGGPPWRRVRNRCRRGR